MAFMPSVEDSFNQKEPDYYTYTERADECFHCGKFIDNNATPWFWHGHGVKIMMHAKCLIDWLPRVQKDAEKIRQAAK